MSAIDAKQFLTQWTFAQAGMFKADVAAIPDDKWTATFGGCTRPASELAADAMGLVVWITGVMRGEAAGDMPKLADRTQTKEGTLALVDQAVGEFAAALGAASDESLLTVVTAPFGMQMPVFALAQIAGSHIWYHDGQLNYVHCLLGDGKIYWQA